MNYEELYWTNEENMIQKGKKVSLEYTVFLEDGMQIDTNVGETPLVFVVGKNQLFPALELAILGLKAGDKKDVVLQAEEAYGPIMPDAFKEVEIDAIPPKFRYVGAILGVQDPAGGVYPIRVHDVKDTKAILDFNHPLAGKTLKFSVKVLEVN
jgi:FKBP-type peptidyl-prolyl cis-trans isomerase 2